MDRQAHIFNVQVWVVGMTLDDFTADEWCFRPHGMNHARWILGHLVLERKSLGNILGMEEEITERDRLFEIGTRPEGVPDDIDGAALLGGFQALHGRFIEYLAQLSDEDLAAETEVQFPETPQTRLGALQFLLMHEGYHVGQLGALRVMAGKGSWMEKMQGE